MRVGIDTSPLVQTRAGTARVVRGLLAALRADHRVSTLGPLVPPSIPMIFYALIANVSVGALFSPVRYRRSLPLPR